MYIELFVLDNLLMNLLILRLASAMLSVPPRFARSLAAAFFGALYAAAAVSISSVLLSPPLKLLLCLAMTLGLSFKGLKGYVYAAVALLLSTLVAGGAVCVIAFALGAKLVGGYIYCGISLRTALAGMLACSLLPGGIRRVLRRRVRSGCLERLEIRHKGLRIRCIGMIDTGNSLCEPLSALPVAVLPKKGNAALAAKASIPIPMRTANSASMAFGLKPDDIRINGSPVNALIAFADVDMALIPASIVQDIQLKGDMANAEIAASNPRSHIQKTEPVKTPLLHKLRRFASGALEQGAGDGNDSKAERRGREGKDGAYRA